MTLDIRGRMPGWRRAAGAAILAAAVAGTASAAPFRIASVDADNLWVVDEASGEVTWCRFEAVSGPKVIDVFGFEAEARETVARAPKPVCSMVQGAQDGSEPLLRTRSISWWSGYTQHHWGGYTTYPFKTELGFVEATDGPAFLGRYVD